MANESSTTADGNASSVNVQRDDLMLELDVTSNDGDLTVTVADSADGGSSWTDVRSFSSFDGGSTGTDRIAVDDLEKDVRVEWTTANMTNGADFTVKAL